MKIFYGLLLSISIFANYLGFDSLFKGKNFDAFTFFMMGIGAIMVVVSRLHLDKQKQLKKGGENEKKKNN